MRTVTILFNLRQLRKEIENETGGLTEDQALLLADVCQALRLNEANTNYVMGDAFSGFIAMPIAYAAIDGNGHELGPPGDDHAAAAGPNPQCCTFCGSEALAPEYVAPPMCSRHFTMTIIVSLLKNHGHPVTVENIRLFVEQKPKTLISPDEVDGLFRPMQHEASYAVA